MLKRNNKSFLYSPNLLHFSLKERIGELGFQKEDFRFEETSTPSKYFFSLSSLKDVMCLGVKKIFERRKVSKKVLYCFGRFTIYPYATVGLIYNLDMFDIRE